jgi:hypothetical protein
MKIPGRLCERDVLYAPTDCFIGGGSSFSGAGPEAARRRNQNLKYARSKHCFQRLIYKQRQLLQFLKGSARGTELHHRERS